MSGLKDSQECDKNGYSVCPYHPTVMNFRSIIIYNYVIKEWVELDPKLDLELVDPWNL